MSRSIARVPVFVTAFLLSTAFALATLLFTVPAAHAVETTTFSQKLSFALCVRSPELTEQISAALADGIVSAKQEAFVDESRAGEFYFAQNGSGRCTITSVAMMVRRRPSSTTGPTGSRSTSLPSQPMAGLPLASNGTSRRAATKSASSTSRAMLESLRELLAQHPEGIAAYDPGVPHAVLLTDYDEETGTFYCSRPRQLLCRFAYPARRVMERRVPRQKPGCRHCRILARLGDSVAKAGL